MVILWTMLWATLAALGVGVGVLVLVRRRGQLRSARPVVDDDAIRRILDTGELSVDEDEPLNLDAIEAEEDRFWSETWDEPDDEWSPR